MKNLHFLKQLTICFFLLTLVACEMTDQQKNRTPVKATVTTDSDMRILTAETVEPLSPSPVIMASPMATDLPAFNIIYALTTESQGVANSQIWLFDTVSQEKQMILSTSLGATIDKNNVRWHPINRNLIYYIQNETDGRWALWKFDLTQRQSEQVTSFFPSDTGGLLANWSADGRWVSLYATNFSAGKTLFSGLLIDSETGESVTNDQFVPEWSPIKPDQFVFYDYDPVITGLANVTIKSVTSPESVQIIDLDFSPISALAWHPYGKNLIATVRSLRHGGFDLYSYDFGVEKWSQIQELENSSRSPVLSWSPSGEWLVLSDFHEIYILEQNKLTDAPTLLATMERPAVIETWLSQPERLVVSSNNKLWILSPNLPGEIVEVLDLEVLELDSTTKMDVWGQ